MEPAKAISFQSHPNHWTLPAGVSFSRYYLAIYVLCFSVVFDFPALRAAYARSH